MNTQELEQQIIEKQALLNDLDQQIEQRQWEMEWSGTKQEYIVRQLRAAIQTVLTEPLYLRGNRVHCDRSPHAAQIQAALIDAINHRIDDLLAISRVRLSDRQIKEYSHLAKEFSFAPVPPPILGADQIMKDGTAVPSRPGIYFIWEGPLVAYVGQSNNLAQRLFNHERLRRSDKISYLCIDSSDLFYHEAFYIGVCRPLRNGRSKCIKSAAFYASSGPQFDVQMAPLPSIEAENGGFKSRPEHD